MKDIKKILVLLIILSVLILICIGILVASLNLNTNDYTDEEEYDPEIIVKESLEKVLIRNDYYTVKNIVEDYYSCLCSLNEKEEDVLILEEDEKQENSLFEESLQIENRKKRIYGFFEENYISETGLTTENIQENLGNYNDLYVIINDMYVRDVTENLKVYFVYGDITEKQDFHTKEFGLMIAVDSYNSTFNIYTADYVKKHNLYELSKKEDFKENYFNIENIENRKYNKYDFEIIDDETYAKDLLKSFTQSIKYNIDYTYDRLHENYKNGKFKEKKDYEEYIQKNENKIATSNLKYYQVRNIDDYKQYICIDGRENYYIFNESSIMNYSLIIDTYTVDLPEFIEKYKFATNKEKVEMNIEKVRSAINDSDYRYIYSKLDKTFKQNKFPKETDLQVYIKNNFIEKNEIEYINFSQEGDIFIYKTKINERKFNIIMQLGEGTEFTMSFSFE